MIFSSPNNIYSVTLKIILSLSQVEIWTLSSLTFSEASNLFYWTVGLPAVYILIVTWQISVWNLIVEKLDIKLFDFYAVSAFSGISTKKDSQRPRIVKSDFI